MGIRRSKMSASIARVACKTVRSFLRTKYLKAICVHQREGSFYQKDTVPYFPEQDKMRSLEAKYPEVEFSGEEFEYVERLLPTKTVPPPPEHEQYPTPSGWVPPNPGLQPSDYCVSRTRNHMIPVYIEKFFSGRICTRVSKIEGDIWKFNEDLLEYVKEEGMVEKKVDHQVHEVGRFIRYKGDHLDIVSKFMLSKGF